MTGYTNPVPIGDIPEGWKIQSIDSLCRNITSGGTPLRSISRFYQNGTIKWIKTKELKDWYIDDSEEKITEEALEESSAKLFPPNTVLMAMYGDGRTITSLGILRTESATNQACCALIANPDICDHLYLFYSLKYHRADFIQLATGGAQRNLSGTLIRNFAIRVPPLVEQHAIARILSSLDDKIELNRRMNETLEAIARAIFKSWFVDFDPVRAKAEGQVPVGMDSETAALFPDSFEETELGMVPKGWIVGKLGEYLSNFDSKRVPVSGAERSKRKGHYPYHGAAGIMDYIDDYLFDGIYVLIGEDGSVIQENGLAVTQYVWGKFWANNHAHVLQGKGAVSTEQLYLYFHFETVAPYITGAVQPKLSQGRMNEMPFLFAGDAICSAFAGLILPLFELLRANADCSTSLIALRDTLLPDLISGKSLLMENLLSKQSLSDTSSFKGRNKEESYVIQTNIY